MSGTYRTLGGSDKFRNFFVGNNKGSRKHVRTKHTWRNNEISLWEKGFNGVDWIQIRLNGIKLLVILRTTNLQRFLHQTSNTNFWGEVLRNRNSSNPWNIVVNLWTAMWDMKKKTDFPPQNVFIYSEWLP
jgi:hypothetical protein